MDKRPVWPDAVPEDVDILQPQRNAEIALGYIMQAAFGTNNVIDGLTVTQTAVPSMAVLVGAGSLITLSTVDTVTSGFGSLAYNTNPLVKIGINPTATTMTTLTAPTTAGQSQNWLVEAQFLEQDTGATVLPFYNAADPTVAWSGPGGGGATSPTARTNTVSLQYKAGTAAATGSQTTPGVDAGWTPIAIITIAYGQSSILNANIVVHPSAPFVATKLGNTRSRLNSNLNLYVSASSGNDSNSGLTSWNAFATLQKAWNYIISNLDLNGYQVTVNVANGTYTQGVIAVGAPVGAIGGIPNTAGAPPPPVTFLGNASTPASCVINVSGGNCFSASSGAQILVNGFMLEASGTSVDYDEIGVGLYSVFFGGIAFKNINFGVCSAAHINAAYGAVVQTYLTGAVYTISGGAQAHIQAGGAGAYATISDAVVTVTGSPAFAQAFCLADFMAGVYASNVTWSGSATGARYSGSRNSFITTNGGQATPSTNYFPGNANGAVTTGAGIT